MSEWAETREGWGSPPTATKWHYFRDGMALCGRWGFAFGLPLERGNDEHSQNCAECKRRRAKEAS